MFVGHYAAALALKKFEKRASLGVLFLSVQLADIVFFPLVLLGIERINIIENFTQSTHFELEYMPYTHSLVGSVLWALAAYALFRWVIVKNHAVALVVALAVFSHWVLDLVVHTPDLPLWNDASLKLGFGLWNNAIAVYVLEAALLLGALWICGHLFADRQSLWSVLLLMIAGVLVFKRWCKNFAVRKSISFLIPKIQPRSFATHSSRLK